MSGTPSAEVQVDEHVLREMLYQQFPDLVGLPINQIERGIDNLIFRVGVTWIARLPRREASAQLILNEQRWMPKLAKSLPIPIPVPLRIGLPTSKYPWNWSMTEWFAGECADIEALADDQAVRLAAFLRALHMASPADAPKNDVRGCPLSDRAKTIEARMALLKKETDEITLEVEAAWKEGLNSPPATEHRWLHGDLHARNVLVESGQISAIIDWGDITSGDIATDLACAWMLFENPLARKSLLQNYAASVEEIKRARSWAVAFGVLLLDSGRVDHPRHAQMGKETLRRVAEDQDFVRHYLADSEISKELVYCTFCGKILTESEVCPVTEFNQDESPFPVEPIQMCGKCSESDQVHTSEYQRDLELKNQSDIFARKMIKYGAIVIIILLIAYKYLIE